MYLYTQYQQGQGHASVIWYWAGSIIFDKGHLRADAVLKKRWMFPALADMFFFKLPQESRYFAGQWYKISTAEAAAPRMRQKHVGSTLQFLSTSKSRGLWNCVYSLGIYTAW